MPERTSYAHGTPAWVDLSTPDVKAATAFYNGLFGWESGGAELPPDEAGGYDILTLRGKRVAGIGPLLDASTSPVWSTYIAVDDADAVSAKAKAAGGTVVVEPMDVVRAGRLGFLRDPTGAFVGLWQAGERIGAELVGEPGTLGWNDLVTRDREAATAFYTTVFGVEAVSWENTGVQYTLWKVAGTSVGGLLPMDERWPATIGSHWMTYFVVEEADATAALTLELGGEVHVEPFDIPNIGRVAVLGDPHGATFSIMTLARSADG